MRDFSIRVTLVWRDGGRLQHLYVCREISSNAVLRFAKKISLTYKVQRVERWHRKGLYS